MASGSQQDELSGVQDEALRLNPQEELCRMYIERCARFREEPPGDDWGGGWVMKTK